MKIRVLMTVKKLKEYLNLYADDKEVVIKGSSGIEYEIREDMISHQTLSDEKREVCKLHIK